MDHLDIFNDAIVYYGIRIELMASIHTHTYVCTSRIKYTGEEVKANNNKKSTTTVHNLTRKKPNES